ncbi:MAG: glutamate formimidoyltransferase [Candidatus Aminicenantes bacterium]|nr:glutamate formimidoyltransferase [Candidatus Aminicenantes bacterium]
MDKIVECVPNFSEGRNKEVINKIAEAVKSVEGVMLLDVDPGEATNRTVYTFVGDPDSVVEAAFRAIKTASELIDMRKHHGEHPRMGAADVVPFVPVSGITMEECAELAERLGKRVGEELGIPVYLYENAARTEERRSLANIREGEYEALPKKLVDPKWKPDFGPAEFNEHVARTGATVIGAREFLIAYNVNLNTRDKKLAHEIALNIREKGRFKRDENGKIVRDENGNKVRVPGKLKAVRAIGWYIDEYGQAQVSINLINYKITPLHKVFEACVEEAQKLGLRVTGSEIVGLVPKAAIVEAGKYFLEKQGRSTAVSEEELIHIADLSMGLSQLYKFEPDEKIIELKLEKEKQRLWKMRVRDFLNELASQSPAPGGGSVAALSGALSAALSAMVSNLTFGKKGFENVWKEIEEVGVKAQALKDEFLSLIDKDTDAFNKLMDAFKISKKDPERDKKIEEATKEATLVPLDTLKKTEELLELAEEVINKGNPNSISDAGGAAIMADAAAREAYLNVLINLQSIQDKDFVERIKKEAGEILKRVEKKARELEKKVQQDIS